MAWTTLIDAAALAGLIDKGEVILFDSRFDLFDPAAGRRAYGSGHLPGARFLDMEEDLSGRPTGRNGRHPLPDRAALAARLARAGVDRGRQAVAYDDAGGAQAARCWWLLRWLGHEAVAVLDGGVQAWVGLGKALVTGEEAALPAGDFAPSPVPGMPVLEAADLLGTGRTIVDARTPERFRGAPHPLDPVFGHIPGARNRFYRDNLGADGRFKPAGTLAAEYRALLADTPPERAVFYCGSGVTAAHDLLAMEHARLGGAALYPGSWSEWISDPARPVERP